MAQVNTQQTETHSVFLISPHLYICICMYVCMHVCMYVCVCKYMHLLLQMLCVDLSHMTLLQGLLLFDPFARIILLQGLG